MMGEDIRELTGILIVFVLIIAAMQWFLLRFTHWSVAFVVTGIIAFVVSFLYVSLSNASPNGGSTGPNVSEFITPTLIIFASLLCGLVLVSYLTQIRLPKLVFILPLVLIAVFAIARYMYGYIDDVTVYREIFSSCIIEIENNSGENLVHEISFQNKSNSLTTTIDPSEKEPPYPFIPRSADKIIFRCVSVKMDRMFFQDFPFDYSLCKEKDGERMGLCFWLRQKVVLPIKIVLQPNNRVDLYIDNHLANQYQLHNQDLSMTVMHKGKYK
ncbi:hypothetical protein [Flavobacterium sp. 5]|uniref:hypothetical protein n=1 Tax=Flavobacterium sp. 5 TaxID=2035199 RepID=UPI000C2C364C|nr:hypothetical protein [Flavobacterium sp. 5]PKB17155.1 hypothetical protein CLU82_2336 [Flavobacterium sp. 5]